MNGMRTAGLLLIALALLGGCQHRAPPRLVAVQLSYEPGFEADAEQWTLSIGDSGRVRQTWEDWGGRIRPDHPPRESTLSAAERRELQERLDPRRLARFGDSYEAAGVTDLRTITITLITDAGSRTITTYGLDFMVDENGRAGGDGGRKPWPRAEEAGDLLEIIAWLMQHRPAR
jgi:hypothetical protein